MVKCLDRIIEVKIYTLDGYDDITCDIRWDESTVTGRAAVAAQIEVISPHLRNHAMDLMQRSVWKSRIEFESIIKDVLLSVS